MGITEKEKLAERKFRDYLSKGLLLYDPKDELYAQIYDKVSYYGYTRDDNDFEIYKTKFSLQVEKNICYILEFDIAEPFRLHGHERSLYKIIEEYVCKEHCVRIFQTTPSGQGLKFWPKMGFSFIGKGLESRKEVL